MTGDKAKKYALETGVPFLRRILRVENRVFSTHPPKEREGDILKQAIVRNTIPLDSYKAKQIFDMDKYLP